MYKGRADISGRVRTMYRNHIILLRHQDHEGEDIETRVEEATTSKLAKKMHPKP